MQKTCGQCSAAFDISPHDLSLLEKVSPVFGEKQEPIPPPTLCPLCRLQRRLLFRNERKFYRRTCDLTGKDIISIYAPDKPCVVYDQSAWWSDAWDQYATGRSFDFQKSFFEQFHALSLVAPRPCVVNMFSENSTYTNHCAYNKNCYMCINTGYSEDCFYCTNYNLYNRDCADCLAIQHCEQCYECVETQKSSFSSFLFQSENCTDCHYCFDCQSCQNCFLCWNLRHKQYCIGNEQYTKEQYAEKIATLRPATWAGVRERLEDFRKAMEERAFHKAISIEQSEGCEGDHIANCRNVTSSFSIFNSEDCSHCVDAGEMKTSIDVYEPFKGELQHETHACNAGYSLMVCSKCYESKNVLYSEYCWQSSDLFGCFGLFRKKYCILNKQYTKEEYEALVPKIIAHMRKTGEWGEFFPGNHSIFAYNETMAQQYIPLTREEALAKGWAWREETEEKSTVTRVIPADKLPETIDAVPDDVLNWAILCERTKRPFKLVKPELDFYRKMHLPIPRLHPDVRFAERIQLRSPWKTWQRECTRCGNETPSTFSPDRKEKILCRNCYLKEVYEGDIAA